MKSKMGIYLNPADTVLVNSAFGRASQTATKIRATQPLFFHRTLAKANHQPRVRQESPLEFKVKHHFCDKTVLNGQQEQILKLIDTQKYLISIGPNRVCFRNSNTGEAVWVYRNPTKMDKNSNSAWFVDGRLFVVVLFIDSKTGQKKEYIRAIDPEKHVTNILMGELTEQPVILSGQQIITTDGETLTLWDLRGNLRHLYNLPELYGEKRLFATEQTIVLMIGKQVLVIDRASHQINYISLPGHVSAATLHQQSLYCAIEENPAHDLIVIDLGTKAISHTHSLKLTYRWDTTRICSIAANDKYVFVALNYPNEVYALNLKHETQTKIGQLDLIEQNQLWLHGDYLFISSNHTEPSTPSLRIMHAYSLTQYTQLPGYSPQGLHDITFHHGVLCVAYEQSIIRYDFGRDYLLKAKSEKAEPEGSRFLKILF